MIRNNKKIVNFLPNFINFLAFQKENSKMKIILKRRSRAKTKIRLRSRNQKETKSRR